MSKIIVNGIATEHRDEGAGKTILMLHGWQDNLHTFDRLAAELAHKYRIVRLDLPGFGGSESPRDPWAVRDYTEFVQAFSRKLAFEPHGLLGHSLGGRVAIMAVSSSILVPAKLILVASAGVAERNSMRSAALYLVAKAGKAVLSGPHLTMAREQVRSWFYGAIGSDYASAGHLRHTFRNIISEDLSAAAAMIRVPTVLIWGSEDTETPLVEGRRLASLIPQSKLEIIEGAGHFVHRERAGKVADILYSFL